MSKTTITPYAKTILTSPPASSASPGPLESVPCIPSEVFSSPSVKKSFEVSSDAVSHTYHVTPRGTLVYIGTSVPKPLVQPPWYPIDGPVDRRYYFAYYGSGMHTSFKGLIMRKWRGSWRSLTREKGEGGGGGESTHVLYISLPELVGQLLSLGVEAGKVPGCLRRGEHGCVGLKLDFEPKLWTGGWSVMKEGMVHVWVC